MGDRAPAGLLFVDGHEDAWPPLQSTTGEAADMELGWLLGKTVSGLPDDLAAVIPRLDPDRVAVIGPRDAAQIAEAAVATIRDDVTFVSFEEAANDPAAVALDAAERLGRAGPWWLHVDLDVLSTDSLAAVDYPQAGGFAWSALTALTRAALATEGVMGWTITIFNPDLDPTGRTRNGSSGTCASPSLHSLVPRPMGDPTYTRIMDDDRWESGMPALDRQPGADADVATQPPGPPPALRP